MPCVRAPTRHLLAAERQAPTEPALHAAALPANLCDGALIRAGRRQVQPPPHLKHTVWKLRRGLPSALVHLLLHYQRDNLHPVLHS